jgi:hypothetical protein
MKVVMQTLWPTLCNLGLVGVLLLPSACSAKQASSDPHDSVKESEAQNVAAWAHEVFRLALGSQPVVHEHFSLDGIHDSARAAQLAHHLESLGWIRVSDSFLIQRSPIEGAWLYLELESYDPNPVSEWNRAFTECDLWASLTLYDGVSPSWGPFSTAVLANSVQVAPEWSFPFQE